MTESTSRVPGVAHRPTRPGAAPARRDRYRADIEGLRAVAVLAVVLYHAGVGPMAGGFTGVDVFYVISGFLITDHLWREVRHRHGLSLAGFYARRARRLLPAAAVVLVATVAVSAAVLPPLQMRSVWKDGLSSALYVANFRFAATRTDYLADTSPSPFQHFWSLGLEEQFYLLWPLLLLAASLVWWSRRGPRRRPHRPAAPSSSSAPPSLAAVLGVLVALSGLSLLASVTLTRSDQPVAFFLLPARAWELGTGAIVALVAPRLQDLRPPVAAVVGWAGLGAVVAACFAYGARTPYPGTAALLPVLGSAAVIAAGVPRPGNGPVKLLGRAGMRGVGRISYSWYLWHYPVLILAPYAVGHRFSVPGDVGLAALSGVLAVLTFRFVEEPARRARWLADAPPGRSLRAGLALSAAGAVACVAAAAAIPSVAGHGRAPVASIAAPAPPAPASRTRPAGAPAEGPAGPGAATAAAPGALPDPVAAELHAAQSQVTAAVTASAPVTAVPANLDPSLAAASASEAAPMVDGCLISFTATAIPPCLFGDTAATRSVVLLGDSHASMWFPAVDAWANANGFRLYVWTKAACPPVAITLYSPVLGRTWTECRDWYANALAAVSRTRPALTVLGIAPNYDAAYDVVQDGPAWLAGLHSTISSLRAAGSSVLVMGSAPSPPQSVPDCLSAHLDSVPACEFPVTGRRIGGGGLEGIDGPGGAAEAATVAAAGGTYADVAPWFCTSTVCDVIVDNLLVYRDNSHITVPYARYLGPLIGGYMTGDLATRPG